MAKKSAIVTGAARGIGYAIAEALLRQGYGVVIGDKDKQACKNAEEALANLGEVRAVAMDVSKEPQVAKLITTCVKAFGGVDLLVNNAAIANPKQGPITALSLDEWNMRLAVNLTGCFLGAKHAIPHLKKRRGSIVNVSSTRALMSEVSTETYATAKGGMEAFTHALAMTYGPEIRVNAIRPGWIDTRDDRLKKPLPKKAHSQHPVGRVGVPEDIAGLVVYLASKDAGFITGQSFTVDGGMVRKMIYED